jgi:hypothetical protein
MDRSADMTVSRLTLNQVSRSIVFLLGALLIFCVEAGIINYPYERLPQSMAQPSGVRPSYQNANVLIFQTTSPLWFDLVEKDISLEHRRFLIEVTQLLLASGCLLGGVIGIFFRLRVPSLLVTTATGSYLLGSLFVVSFPATTPTLIIVGCSSFGLLVTVLTLPYSLWHQYLKRW